MLKEIDKVCFGKLIHEFVPEHDFSVDRYMNFGDVLILGFTEETMEAFGEIVNQYGLKLYKGRDTFFITLGGRKGKLEVLRVSESVIKEKRKECSKCKHKSKCKPTIIVAETEAGVVEIISYNLSFGLQKDSSYIY